MSDNEINRPLHFKPIKNKSRRSLRRSIQKRIRLSDRERGDAPLHENGHNSRRISYESDGEPHDDLVCDDTDSNEDSSEGNQSSNEEDDSGTDGENGDVLLDDADRIDNDRNESADGDDTDGDGTDRDDDDDDEDDIHIDEQEQNYEPQPDDPSLFEGAPISVGESLICILTFAMRFSLTGVALSHLLNLIALHCPAPNLCKKSLFLFKKYFESVHTPMRQKFYCSECYLRLEGKETICESCSGDNPLFNMKAAYFIEIPILDQLRTLYGRTGFCQLLQWRHQRIKKNDNNYEDIYDGEIYKELSQPPNLLSHPNNISFTWNTDGVSLFKSSKFEIWPFYLSINELPYSQRTKKENLLLAGLWFGPKKPLPSLFLKSICDDLDELKNGIDIEIPRANRTRHVRAEVLCGTCDLPAKATFLNMKYFNGEYGCQKCKIRSEPLEPGSLTRIYPFKEDLELRDQAQTAHYAAEATIIKDAVFGVKGNSVISRMTTDYIRQTAVDSMHAVFLGIVRALLIIWFDPTIGKYSEYRQVVDEKIRLISPPDFLPRLPRAIMDNLMYIKASELKVWFFYYSIPILNTFMSNFYLNHYMMLVKAIYLLNQQSVSIEMLNLAEELLIDFSRQFSLLYGRENMTANLHQLLHLPQTVRDFGPLFTTSCFPFENSNGVLKALVTGTKFAELQICTGVSLFMSMPELKKKLLPDSPCAKFCDRLTSQQKKYKAHRISNNSLVIGTMGKINQIPLIVNQALHLSDIEILNVRIFYRFMRSGILYTSQLYQRSRKTNSMYVKYNENNCPCFGIIHCFMKMSACVCDYCDENCDARYYAVIEKLRTHLPFSAEAEITIPFMHRYRRTDSMTIVEVNDIACVCFCVKIEPENVTYIIEPVNLIEIE